jgi:hypothetical protein
MVSPIQASDAQRPHTRVVGKGGCTTTGGCTTGGCTTGGCTTGGGTCWETAWAASTSVVASLVAWAPLLGSCGVVGVIRSGGSTPLRGTRRGAPC